MSYKYCPHCGEELPPPTRKTSEPVPSYVRPEVSTPKERPTGPIVYDQTVRWRELIKEVTEAAPDEQVIQVPNEFNGGPCVVHLIFDSSVSPRGGVIQHMVAMASSTQPSPSPKTPKDLAAMGYLIDDGKVVLENGVPVGPIWPILTWWGVTNFKINGLSEPIVASPERKGDPAFIDEEILAFGAKFKNGVDVRMIITLLIAVIQNGEGDLAPAGRVRLADVSWVR